MKLEEFLGHLIHNKINLVIDTRSRPYSRWNPVYNKNRMPDNLGLMDIDYLWWGSHPGGLDENIDFECHINEVVELAQNKRLVLLCACGDYKKCHRNSLLKPALVNKVKVVHIN